MYSSWLALLTVACTSSQPVKNWPLLTPATTVGVQDVVIFEVDTLRADHLPWYGYARDTMPLSGERDWWVQEHAYAASSWTAPSVASVMSGLDLHQHGVRQGAVEGDTLESPTFAAWLASQGVNTALFTGNPALTVESNDHADWQLSVMDDTDPGNGLVVVEAGLEWLDTVPPERRAVLFLQPMDPHLPWSPLPEDLGTWADTSSLPFSLEDSWPTQQAAMASFLLDAPEESVAAVTTAVIDLYDEELLGVDRALDALLTGLEARGRLDDTLVVFTADHGETLFDEGLTFGHGGSLREELVHVPLLMLSPALSGRREDCLTVNQDLFPTILDYMDLPPMSGIMGQSSRDACRDTVRSSLYHGQDDVVTLLYLSVQDLTAKLVYDCAQGISYAWDLQADPAAIDRQSIAAVPGAAALVAPIEAFRAEIQIATPEQRCTMTSSH